MWFWSIATHCNKLSSATIIMITHNTYEFIHFELWFLFSSLNSLNMILHTPACIFDPIWPKSEVVMRMITPLLKIYIFILLPKLAASNSPNIEMRLFFASFFFVLLYPFFSLHSAQLGLRARNLFACSSSGDFSVWMDLNQERFGWVSWWEKKYSWNVESLPGHGAALVCGSAMHV